MNIKHIKFLYKKLEKYLELKKLKKDIPEDFYKLEEAVLQSYYHNPWFCEEFTLNALKGILVLINPDNIDNWLSRYDLSKVREKKKVAIIMPGNIPAAGFHDLLCVLLSGHKAIVKLSSKDEFIIPVLMEMLAFSESLLYENLEFAKGIIEKPEAVIASGSDNTAKTLKKYFQNIPSIIRGHRFSLAYLTGLETEDELSSLADDVFLYFGLGCRNVSKIFIPGKYDIENLRMPFSKWQHLKLHNRYANNYDYYKAINILNQENFIDFGHVMLKESTINEGNVSELIYERYTDIENIKSFVEINRDKIQCIIGRGNFFENEIYFGNSQYPKPWEYPDNIDVLDFLINL